MTKVVQIRGGTTATLTAATLQARELFFDTTLNQLALGTGAGAGTHKTIQNSVDLAAAYQPLNASLTNLAANTSGAGVLVKLTTTTFTSSTTVQLAGLNVTQLATFATISFGMMTTVQLGSFSSAQIASLTSTTVTFGSMTSTQVTGTANATVESAPAISAGTLTLALASSSYFRVSLNAAITTLTITTTFATAIPTGFILEFTADGTSRAVTWPASVKWPSATAPTLTSTNAKRDKFLFMTRDAGTTWDATIIGQNF